jgi:hypothetical protein
MTRKRMPALDFAGARLFEPFGRTLMGLQLWHKNVLDSVVDKTTFLNIPQPWGRLAACAPICNRRTSDA